MASASKNEVMRLERAATAEKLARKFGAQDGNRKFSRGMLMSILRSMDGEEARQRTNILIAAFVKRLALKSSRLRASQPQSNMQFPLRVHIGTRVWFPSGPLQSANGSPVTWEGRPHHEKIY